MTERLILITYFIYEGGGRERERKSGSLKNKQFPSKVNQMRSLDLDFRLKIRIFNLEGLRCFESKNF